MFSAIFLLLLIILIILAACTFVMLFAIFQQWVISLRVHMR